MNRTNLTHKKTHTNPTVYDVYFTQNVSTEIERIAQRNFCDTTIQPYNKWLKYFYATVQWVRQIYQWLSLLTYGFINGSQLQNNQYQYSDQLGIISYQRMRDANNNLKILVTNIQFNPYTFQKTTILMENKQYSNKIVYHLKESQLRTMIRESIRKVLNII